MITVLAVLNTTLRINFPYLINTLKGGIVAVVDELNIYILITIKAFY